MFCCLAQRPICFTRRGSGGADHTEDSSGHWSYHLSHWSSIWPWHCTIRFGTTLLRLCRIPIHCTLHPKWRRCGHATAQTYRSKSSHTTSFATSKSQENCPQISADTSWYQESPRQQSLVSSSMWRGLSGSLLPDISLKRISTLVFEAREFKRHCGGLKSQVPLVILFPSPQSSIQT